MDGDVAPLPELAELARRHGCRLMVDEAHGTGALGPGGRGTVAAAGLEDEVDVIVGTLGKALGGYGAYVCASAELARAADQHLPPVHLLHRAAAPVRRRRAGRARRCSRRGPSMVERLRRNAAVMREALRAEGLERRPVAHADRPGDRRRRPPRRRALRARRSSGGVFAQAIRPPTVPEGTSRLRLTVMANHRADELRRPRPRIDRQGRRAEPRRRRPGPSSSSAARPEPPCGGVFVTGTGTEVGKTVVAAVLARTAAAGGSGSPSSSRR